MRWHSRTPLTFILVCTVFVVVGTWPWLNRVEEIGQNKPFSNVKFEKDEISRQPKDLRPTRHKRVNIAEIKSETTLQPEPELEPELEPEQHTKSLFVETQRTTAETDTTLPQPQTKTQTKTQTQTHTHTHTQTHTLTQTTTTAVTSITRKPVASTSKIKTLPTTTSRLHVIKPLNFAQDAGIETNETITNKEEDGDLQRDCTQDGICDPGMACVDSSKGPYCMCETKQCQERQQQQPQHNHAVATKQRESEQNGGATCVNKNPICTNAWRACCPGGDGGPQCSESDCEPTRKQGKKCLGVFMQLECPATCDLCDTRALEDSSEALTKKSRVRTAVDPLCNNISLAVKQLLPSITSDGGVVVLTTMSIGFLEFFVNWKRAAARVGVFKFLVVAEDLAAYETLLTLIPGQVILSPTPLDSAKDNSALSYKSESYKALVGNRPRYIRVLLEMGLDVLYTDIDTVWLDDPLKHIAHDNDDNNDATTNDNANNNNTTTTSNNNNFNTYTSNDNNNNNSSKGTPQHHHHTHTHTGVDMWVQSDAQSPTDYAFHMLCTGFMLIRANKASIALIFDWEYELYIQPKSTINQEIFNRVARTHMRRGAVTINALAYAKFPSGALTYHYQKWMSTRTSTPVVIHNNFMVGKETKKNKFIQHGWWFV